MLHRPAPSQSDSRGNGQASKAESASAMEAAVKSAIVAAVSESEDFVQIVMRKLEKLGMLKQLES